MIQKKNRFYALGFFLLFLVGLLQFQIHRLSEQNLLKFESKSEYIGTSIDPQIIKRLLGIRTLVADLLWVDTLIKADSEKETVSYGKFYQSFRNIVTLDPDNIYAYYVGGLFLSIIKDDVKGASALMRAGVDRIHEMKAQNQALPKSAWLVPYTLGYNLIFEEQAFEEGSKYVIEAAGYKEASSLVRQIAERVSTERGRLEIANRILTEFYKRLDDDAQKKEVQKKMLRVAVQLELLDLNDGFTLFKNSTGAYAFNRKRQLEMFLRSMNHGSFDLAGHVLVLDRFGKIVSEEK